MVQEEAAFSSIFSVSYLFSAFLLTSSIRNVMAAIIMMMITMCNIQQSLLLRITTMLHQPCLNHPWWCLACIHQAWILLDLLCAQEITRCTTSSRTHIQVPQEFSAMPAPNSAASQSECIIATFAQVISARPADTLEFNNDTYSIRFKKDFI